MRNVIRHPVTSWSLLAGYGLAIFIQSCLPSLPIGSDLPGTDKLLHFAAYALMGILACRAFAAWPRPGSALVLFMAGWAFTCLFGLSDEWHQSFVPGRTADVWDWAADVLGGMLGAFWASRRLRPAGWRGAVFLR